MNWKMGIKLALVVVATAIALYYTYIINMDWQTIAYAATFWGVIGTLILAAIGLKSYIGNLQWNFYRYLADIYYDTLKKGLEYPHFCDPEKTRKYESEWRYSPKKYEYDAFARMCWAYAEDIYDSASRSFSKKDFIELYAPTFERIKATHGVWLQKNKSTFPMKGFLEFVEFNKWRNYLDPSAAERIGWDYAAYDYDEKILNPMHVGKNCSFCWDEIPSIRFRVSGERFKEILKHFGVELSDTPKIETTDDDKIINISLRTNSLSLRLTDEKMNLTINYGRTSRTYEFIAKTENGKLNIYRKNPMLEYVRRKIPRSDLVVADFGCGNGYFVKILAESGKFSKIYGTDYSDNMVKNAQNKCESFGENVEILKEDMKDLTLFREELKQKYGDKLDRIFSINSILPQNPHDTEKILCQIALTLNPDGEFVAILPSFDTVEYLKSLEFNKFKEKRKEYIQQWYKNLLFLEKIHSCRKIWRWEVWELFYYYLKFWWKMEWGAWKHLKFWDRVESGAMLDTLKLFYKDRKMNVYKRLYADDGINVQRFIHEKEIEPMLNKAGLKLKEKPEKLYYPWDLTKKFNYGYFPGNEEIWDWFVVAEKVS